MKKLLAMVLALVIVLCTGCNANPTSQTPSSGVSSGAASGPESEEKDSIVYFCRVLGDFGFNDNGWLGCQNAAEKYGYNANVVELGDDTATFENAFLEACDSGKYSVIVTQNGSSLGDYVRKYAADYPNLKFIVFDMGLTEDANLPENVYGIAYRSCDATFLSGALAAKISDTNKMAILSNDNPSGNDFAVGFVSGAKYANPDCKVYYYYGMADAAAWQEQASSLFDEGCDIIQAASGRFGLGIFNEATNRGGLNSGLKCFGIDTDMYYSLTKSETAQFADVVVTSATKNLAATIEMAFDKMKDNSLNWGEIEIYGYAQGGVGLAINDHYKKVVPADVQEYMEKLMADIESGAVVTKSGYDFASQEELLNWIQPQLG